MLFRSDRGIILFRQQLKEQISEVERGEDPMCVFRDPILNTCLELPLEADKFGANRRPPKYVPGEAGYSRDAALIEETLATWDTLAQHAAIVEPNGKNGHSGTHEGSRVPTAGASV